MAKLCCFCPKEMLAPRRRTKMVACGEILLVGIYSNMALVLVGATITMYKVN